VAAVVVEIPNEARVAASYYNEMAFWPGLSRLSTYVDNDALRRHDGPTR
jgi:hypothetical protein